MFYFGKGSRERLRGVHADLVLVAGRAITISTVDFSAIEGARTIEKQREYVDGGTSWTMDSRHLPFLVDGLLLAHAVDLVPWVNGSSDFDTWTHFHKIASAMKQASRELKISVLWGGDWRSRKDGPHWYLSRRRYPKREGA